MALGIQFECEHCGHTIMVWDEGLPYLIDERGKKRYVPHPDPDWDKAIGNDLPYLCLNCGTEFPIDSRARTDVCPHCGSQNIARTTSLEGRLCPMCKKGRFYQDPDFWVIS